METYRLEGIGIIDGNNALWMNCKGRGLVASMRVGQTIWVDFQSGAGTTTQRITRLT